MAKHLLNISLFCIILVIKCDKPDEPEPHPSVIEAKRQGLGANDSHEPGGGYWGGFRHGLRYAYTAGFRDGFRAGKYGGLQHNHRPRDADNKEELESEGRDGQREDRDQPNEGNGDSGPPNRRGNRYGPPDGPPDEPPMGPRGRPHMGPRDGPSMGPPGRPMGRPGRPPMEPEYSDYGLVEEDRDMREESNRNQRPGMGFDREGRGRPPMGVNEGSISREGSERERRGDRRREGRDEERGERRREEESEGRGEERGEPKGEKRGKGIDEGRGGGPGKGKVDIRQYNDQSSGGGKGGAKEEGIENFVNKDMAAMLKDFD